MLSYKVRVAIISVGVEPGAVKWMSSLCNRVSVSVSR